jgi:hypothetical protein
MPAHFRQITTDLDKYGYTLDVHYTGSGATGTSVPLTGNYRLFYNIGSPDNNTYESGTDVSISYGTADPTLTFVGSSYHVVGSLSQTAGPDGPAPYVNSFVNLGDVYNNHPWTLSGDFTNGLFSGTITQTASAVPLPAAAWTGLAGLAGLGLLSAAKRRRQLA